jgi:hypothetical protein
MERVFKLELPHHLYNNNNDGEKPVRIFAITLNVKPYTGNWRQDRSHISTVEENPMETSMNRTIRSCSSTDHEIRTLGLCTHDRSRGIWLFRHE